MEKNIRNIRQAFKEKGIFYTPPELLNTIKEYVDFAPASIYDPTCGQGNLLSVFPDETPKFGQELDENELRKAKERLKNFTGYAGDTLTDDGFPEMKFDLIVANPPFSIRWEPDKAAVRFITAPCVPPPSKADYAFILHILYHLAENGKAICVEFPGILYRGNREGKIRQWIIENNWIERVVHIPGNTFVDTTIATCVLVLSKAKKTTDIIFEDRETGRERAVSIEEIADNDYILSVSSYIVNEAKKEIIDPLGLENEARETFIKKLKRELDFEKEVCRMEGISMTPFLQQLKATLEEYES